MGCPVFTYFLEAVWINPSSFWGSYII